MEGLDAPRPTMNLRQRQIIAMAVVLLVLATAVSQLGTALASGDTLYLHGDGLAIASMTHEPPTARPLPNYDPNRDHEPGLLLSKSSKGRRERDPAKHQQWIASISPVHLDGPASLTLWSAMKDFGEDKRGKIKAFLQDCAPDGTDCSVIDTAKLSRKPWDNDSEWWIERSLDFGHVTHTIEEGRALAVKLIVHNDSGDDMWFAYDTAAFASALNVVLVPPPPPTTTPEPPPPTTTTTTTTKPPPPLPATTTTTTTTTQPPATTTTQPPATTTTTLPPTPTTTTAQPPASTTTTKPPATTPTSSTLPPLPPTTTAPPIDPLPFDEPADVRDPSSGSQADPALGVVAGLFTDPPPSDGALGSLFDGLELVVPPAAAAAVLSPLVLGVAVTGAFAAAGRELLVPGLLLVLVAIWIAVKSRSSDDERSQA